MKVVDTPVSLLTKEHNTATKKTKDLELREITPPAMSDSFEAKTRPDSLLERSHTTALTLAPMNRPKNPDLGQWMQLSNNFSADFLEVKPNNFRDIDEILITPSPYQKVKWYSCPQNDLTEWHRKNTEHFNKELVEAVEEKVERYLKTEEDGPGLPHLLSEASLGAKEAGHFIRDKLTMRGGVFSLSDQIFGKNINEMLPNYGVRKATAIGMRLSEISLNGLLTALGYVFAPLTFGISKIAADHGRSGITVGMEAKTSKLLGIDDKKVVGRSAIRAVQLEAPKFVPVVGDMVEMAETGVTFFGLSVLASSALMDVVMKAASNRYVATFVPKDLGDSRVLGEMTGRLKYLSRFLIPHGQKLLHLTTNPQQKEQIMVHLREQMDAMRDMEMRRTRALYFYVLALASGRVPEEYLAQIKQDCSKALEEGDMDCHQTAKSCLATLNLGDELNQLRPARIVG
jgi:hypothetical protein